MSTEVTGKVSGVEISWSSPPRGGTGSAIALLRDGRKIEVRWRRDDDGLWLELPSGIHGFDLEGEADDSGHVTYSVSQRGGAAEWSGLSFVRAGEETAAQASGGPKKSARVRAQMPGKILRVLVKAGASVQAGQPLLVMEAMKMENEIKAQVSGVVRDVKVIEGQAVETGADLLAVDPI